MKNKILLLGFIFLTFNILLTSCAKDKNNVSGNITYVNDITGLEQKANGAEVFLTDVADPNHYVMKTTADADGYYEFYPVPDGYYYVEATLEGTLGYYGKSKTFIVKGKDEVDIDFKLE